MSRAIRPPAPTSTHDRPTVSTRYDRHLIEWMTAKLNISKAELLKRALDEYIARVMKEAA